MQPNKLMLHSPMQITTALPFRFCTVQLPSPANTQADTAHATSASFFFPASDEVKENEIPDPRKAHFKVGKMQSQVSFHERTQDLHGEATTQPTDLPEIYQSRADL